MIRHRVSVKRIERIGTTVCADVALWGVKSSNICNLSLHICGRRVVDFWGIETAELQGRSRQVGLHNVPSSPASPTKGNSRKAVSFFVVLPTLACPKPLKALGIPTTSDFQGLLFCFSPISIYRSLLSTVSPILAVAAVSAPPYGRKCYENEYVCLFIS